MPDPIDSLLSPRRREEEPHDPPQAPPTIEARWIRIDDGSLADLFERLPKTPTLSPAAFAPDPQAPPPDECVGAKPTLVRARDLPRRATITSDEIASRTGADAKLLESSRQAICAQTGTDPFSFADKTQAGREFRRGPEMTHDEQLQATLRMIGSMRDNPLAAMAYLYARGNDESLAQQEATVGVADAAWGIAGGIGAARAARAEHVEPPPASRATELSVKLVNQRRPINAGSAWTSDKYAKLPEELRAKYPVPVRFKATGFVDLTPVAIANVRVKGLKGDVTDFVRASVAAGFGPVARPVRGYTWHHEEDGETMLLVPSDLHDAIRHTGGAAVIRARAKRGAT